MLVGYFHHGKNFLDLYIYCCYYMYFQISFILVDYIHLSLIQWSLFVTLIPVLSIYCNDNVVIFKFLIFVIIYLDIQPVYSSVYCSVIGNRRYFSMGMSLCNTFCVFVDMEDENMPWHILVEEEKYLDNEMAPNPILSLFISFSSVFQLFMTSNPSKISPLLTRD